MIISTELYFLKNPPADKNQWVKKPVCAGGRGFPALKIELTRAPLGLIRKFTLYEKKSCWFYRKREGLIL